MLWGKRGAKWLFHFQLRSHPDLFVFSTRYWKGVIFKCFLSDVSLMSIYLKEVDFFDNN